MCICWFVTQYKHSQSTDIENIKLIMGRFKIDSRNYPGKKIRY